ncbi:MAG: hypothetical protein KUG81_05970 [Gammaproteobacteria bacterium]|nr:hypothetical protein [Gammaproteobacteria bacterium]
MRPKNTFIVLIIMALLAPSTVQAHSEKSMSFQYKGKDSRTIGLDFYQVIYAEGNIAENTSEKFIAFAQKHNILPGAMVYLQSNGGNLSESLRLGRAIRKLGFNTTVGSKNFPLKGHCYSACAFSFLGGQSRFMHGNNQKYGLHRFYNKELSADDAQIISSKLISYIEEMGVKNDLFHIMTLVGKEEIVTVEKESLIELNAVNNGILKLEWEIQSFEKGMYLRGLQITDKGENKITFICDPRSNSIVTTAWFESPYPKRVVNEFVAFTGLYIDNYQFEKKMIASALDSSVMVITVLNNQEIWPQLINAKELGVYMQTTNQDFFAGFKIKQTEKSKRILRDIANTCLIDSEN